MGTSAFRRTAGGCAIACAALVLPLTNGVGIRTAHAATSGSIIYVKRGYVWVARPNGRHAHKLTKKRLHWAWPSEADSGKVVAAGGKQRINKDGSDADAGSELYRFGPGGKQLGRPIPTWGSHSTPSCPTYPPSDVRISPNGKKIAYGIFECGDDSETALWTPTKSKHLNFPGQSLGQEDYYQPSWVSNSAFVVSHVGPTVTDSQARWYLHKVSQADDTGVKGWAEPSMTGTGAHAVISRAGNRLVVFEDDAADYLDGKPRHVRMWVYTGQDIPDNWTLACKVGLKAGHVSQPLRLSPSLSPDGTVVMWGDDRGVESASLANPSDCSSITPHLVVKGGKEPFYSASPLH
jgi:hypothetical protein